MGIEISARSGRHLSSQDATGPATGVALVLHGGRVASREPVTRYQLAVLRIAVLAAAVHRQVADQRIAVWNLRFGVRGWNGAEASPVADVRWALEQIRLHAGLPVAIVGHSMGGRAALRVAGEKSVRGVVALAPWLPADEPMAALHGRSLVIVHGSADRITDPRGSARYADRARAVAESVQFHEIPGSGHAMLRSSRRWTRLTSAGVVDVLNRRSTEPHPEPRTQDDDQPGEVSGR